MASSTAIEECKYSFNSLCPQVGCLHAPPPEHVRRRQRTTRLTRLPEEELNLIPKLRPYQIPDLVWRCPAVASTKGSDSKPWELEPDKYVPMKCYQPTYDENLQLISEEPVLISDLRPGEQIVAYENQLTHAPRHKIREYYALHLSRLADMRADIANETVIIERERAKAAWLTKWFEKDKATRAYRMALKRRETWRAFERAVGRLLERCESVLKGEEGFEVALWRRIPEEEEWEEETGAEASV